MLFTLIAPILVLFIFRARTSVVHHAAKGALMPGSSNIMAFIFPIGAAYTLLVLTNFIYNCLGTEGPGIQFYFAAPIEFQAVLLGKNLAYCVVLLFDIVVVWVGVCFLYQVPRADTRSYHRPRPDFRAAGRSRGRKCLVVILPQKIRYGCVRPKEHLTGRSAHRIWRYKHR